MPEFPVNLPSTIALLGLAAVLAVLSTGMAGKTAPAHPRAISVAIWSCAALLIGTPLLEVDRSATIPLVLYHSSLQFMLVLVVATLRFRASAAPGTGRTLAAAAWILLLYSLSLSTLQALQPGTVLIAMGEILLAGFLLIYAAVTLIHPLTHALPPTWLRVAAVAAALLGVISPLLNGNVAIAVDEISGQPTGVAAISTSRPPPPRSEIVESGITTTGLGKSDLSLSFSISGLIAASKPNFHQLIRLRIHAQIGDSRQQVLHFEATGVPQPDGSLNLLHSQLSLHAAIPHLAGAGQATHVLADAIFGTIRLHRQKYSFLLSYTPVGLHAIKGTLTLWPSGIAVEPTVLD